MTTSMRWLPLALMALLVAGRGDAQVAPLITNIEGRSTTSLNGQWQVIVDPYDVGAVDYHAHALQGNGAFYKNYKPQSKSELVEYDFDTSGRLNVPGDWNTQRDALLFYEGSVWYKRSFNYTKGPKKRVFVHFGAANYMAYVYLNGEELGQHEGGFTPFDFEITDRVRPEGNFLVVRVNNTRGKDYVPTVNTDWWNYGGITRPVTLVEVPETFIQDYSVQLEKGSTRQIKGWIQLNGKQLQQKVTIRIAEAGVNKTLQTDAAGRAEFSFEADLTLWSPESPKLYKVEIASETDHLTDQIGFRSIRVQGTDILLNGKSVFLRGINIHEEAPMRSRTSMERRRRADPAGLGERAGVQLCAAGALSAQRSHDTNGRPDGNYGVGGSAGLLDNSMGKRRDAAKRGESTERIDCSRSQSGGADHLFGSERDTHQRCAEPVSGAADSACAHE